MKKFKPFEKVLIRLHSNTWEARFFSHIVHNTNYALTSGAQVCEDNIIPYEGNEHLLGTDKEPEEEIMLKKEERIILSDSITELLEGRGYINLFCQIGNTTIVDMTCNCWNYCIPFSQFKEKNTKHDILCVRNGKLVRYE